MRFQLMIYLTAFIGIVFHFFVRYRDTYTKKEVFNWKDNILFSIYVTFVVMIMVTFCGEISGFISKTGIDVSQLANGGLVWFFIGYFGDSIWKNIEGASVIKFLPNMDAPSVSGDSVPPATPKAG